jgi:hypothetical protein
MTTRLEPVAWRFLYGNAPEGCWSYSNTAPDEADKNHKRVQPLYAAAPAPDGMREAIAAIIDANKYEAWTVDRANQMADAILAIIAKGEGRE